jgi:adenosylhomocysteine nucleosidase
MSIGLVMAMEEELAPFLKYIEDLKLDVVSGKKIYSGKISGKPVIIILSGIGKVNASMGAQILIRDFDAEKIINVGVAGGLKSDMELGDIVIGDSLVQHDMDATVFGDPHGQVPRLDTFEFKSDEAMVALAVDLSRKIDKVNVFRGRVVTGDQFLTSKEKVAWLVSEFGAIAAEMEGASIAQTAYLNGTPFLIVKSISDKGDSNSRADYESFKEDAIENYVSFIKEIIANC